MDDRIEAVVMERPPLDIKYGTLGVPLAGRRDPTDKDFADPRFEVIWELIKRVDVDFRNGTFSGATGNDVCAVLDALDAAGTAVEAARGALYHELLYAVAKKHPHESRHQTALRYIQQAERGHDGQAQAVQPGTTVDVP